VVVIVTIIIVIIFIIVVIVIGVAHSAPHVRHGVENASATTEHNKKYKTNIKMTK
jgi:preprotein translocase subunit SecG